MNFKEIIVSKLINNQLDIFNHSGNKIAILDLILEQDLENAELINKITQWRNEYKTCFLTEFKPTNERTKNWLKNAVIGNPNRLLFKILSLEGELIGHIGAIRRDHYIEYDYYILGKKIPLKDFAITIARRMLLWLLEIEPKMFILGNVRSDNIHALDFHKRTGFNIYREVPLKRNILKNNEIEFTPIRNNEMPPDIFLVEIRANKTDFIRN